ncbi:MAG TPA: response regulator [Verrucomicrobiae bacterium]
MTRVLIVDDDPLVQLAYKGALTRRGFHVEIAEDGVAALKAMHRSRPDVVVLDLMMPKLSGTDVLQVMRSQPDLIDVPAILFSNSYIDAETAKIAGTAAQRGVHKSRCTPAILADTIREVLEGGPGNQDATKLVSLLKGQSPGQGSPGRRISDAEWREATRAQLASGATVTSAALRTAFDAWKSAAADGRGNRLWDFYRRIHFLTTLAGMAEHPRLTQMMTPLEALVFRLTEEPTLATSSVLLTISTAIELVATLLQEAENGEFGKAAGGKVLVVDDDAVSNRMVTWALGTANLQARSTEDPALGLEMLQQESYDLILLDLEMPGMHGFEFCQRVRALPQYAKTPVIYVTVHSNFDNRAAGAMAGGDDLIAKPVLPLELAVKSTVHLLRLRTPSSLQAAAKKA